MKIGIDCRLWNETGVGRYIRNLVKELAEIDHENDYVLFARSQDVNGVKLSVQGSKFRVQPVDIHWHSLSEQLRFTNVLEKEQLDLMHFPYFSHPVSYRKPFVITIHDLIIYHFSTGKASTLPLPLYQLKRQAFSFVLKHGVKHASKVIVPLETVKDDIARTFGIPEEKIAVTKEGFDRSIKRRQETNDQRLKTHGLKNAKYFLYVGNAYPHKNVEGLIRGFMRFRQDHQEYQLRLVGKNDYFYNRIEQGLTTAEKEALVFSHDVDDIELSLLYQHATALVSASKMEGFGLPPLEAMALGTPVLVSAIPSFKEVCADVAFYFDPTNPDDIADKMKSLVSTPEDTLNKQLQKGQERAEQFSWKKMAEQTLKVYQQAA